ncbi:hypothetical protein KY290_021384 [Solanum tuberosum]|uniref:Uncharacterized protein n=1 Tax=Solanum tuberosum TaxID=4113 RepID=A0ABQ7V1G2_SOLTU|nr:hypothetical protein KY289_020549 [Solanum tuberosum]KAH0693215.1 hypothetical protein KY285_020312 [Solanum tuberosum]KAH0757891.1 hypothetical protein KY290_021384 [Solanum tuberosum]
MNDCLPFKTNKACWKVAAVMAPSKQWMQLSPDNQVDQAYLDGAPGKKNCDGNMFPLGVPSWRDIKQQKLDHTWAAIEDKFESVYFDDHDDHIFGWMNELWNKWTGYLHTTYVKIKPIVHALKNIPKGVEKKEWEWLVKEHFFSKSIQVYLEI